MTQTPPPDTSGGFMDTPPTHLPDLPSRLMRSAQRGSTAPDWPCRTADGWSPKCSSSGTMFRRLVTASIAVSLTLWPQLAVAVGRDTITFSTQTQSGTNGTSFVYF